MPYKSKMDMMAIRTIM